jgi:hypothetical protein
MTSRQETPPSQEWGRRARGWELGRGGGVSAFHAGCGTGTHELVRYQPLFRLEVPRLVYTGYGE